MVGKKASEESRREDILRAAYDVAARQGLEALTLRAVAARADVSHGTVVFHFKRKHELIVALLDRVLYATAILRMPDDIRQITRPLDRLHALLRSEMERLSSDPRHFRLFLEYWTIGVRSASIRQRVRVALETYRSAFKEVAAEAVSAELSGARARARQGTESVTIDGIAAVTVSLVHGCALQGVIDPKGFSIHQHFAAAAQMLERLAYREPTGVTLAG